MSRSNADAVFFANAITTGIASGVTRALSRVTGPAASRIAVEALPEGGRRQLSEHCLGAFPRAHDDGGVVLLQRARVELRLRLDDANVAPCGKQFHHTTFLDRKISNSDHTRPYPAAHPTCPKPPRLMISIRKKPGNGSSRWTRCSRPMARERAHFLLERLIDFTRRSGTYLPFKPNTAYVNTISPGHEKEYPGDRTIERRIEAYIRWNAMAMVVQANRQSSEYGGHIASYASAATLYEVGFNHFWRAPVGPASGRHGVHPGTRVARHLRARVSRRAADGEPLAPLPQGSGQRRRPQLVSASVADAGLLAVPDRVDGPRADDGDLPGALPALPRASRRRAAHRTARSGRSSATARWTSPSRWARSRCRYASTSTTSCS